MKRSRPSRSRRRSGGFSTGQRRLKQLLAVLLFLLFAGGSGLYLSGRIIAVADGDTVTVFADGRTQRIRLYGIDCPESGQRGGSEATAFTRSLGLFAEVGIKVINKDVYGRDVAIVTLSDGRILNEELVRSGHAWVYEKYCGIPRCMQWRVLEHAARQKKAGLWQDSKPVPPWRWRRNNKR